MLPYFMRIEVSYCVVYLFLNLLLFWWIKLLHSDDPNLQPATWRHNQLLSKFDIELIGHVPKGLFSLAFVDREGQTVNTVLHKNVDPEHFLNLSREPSILAGPPDLIVMGHHGRKGPKSKKSAIGSTADQALRLVFVLLSSIYYFNPFPKLLGCCITHVSSSSLFYLLDHALILWPWMTAQHLCVALIF